MPIVEEELQVQVLSLLQSSSVQKQRVAPTGPTSPSTHSSPKLELSMQARITCSSSRIPVSENME